MRKKKSLKKSEKTSWQHNQKGVYLNCKKGKRWLHMTKITKREMFEQIRTHLTDEAEIAFIDHELELLAKKNERRSDKPTAKQVANATLIEEIYEAMETGKSYRIAEIQALIPDLADASGQKVSALVKKMRDNVLVSREVVKGVAYFTKI